MTFSRQMRWESSLVRGKRQLGGMRESIGRTNKPERLKHEVGVRGRIYYNRKQNWKESLAPN